MNQKQNWRKGIPKLSNNTFQSSTFVHTQFVHRATRIVSFECDVHGLTYAQPHYYCIFRYRLDSSCRLCFIKLYYIILKIIKIQNRFIANLKPKCEMSVNFFDQLEKHFGEKNLYALFSLSKNASQNNGSYFASNEIEKTIFTQK